MEKEVEKKEKIDMIRRKLIEIGIWTAPVMLLFTSKKMWAQTPYCWPGEGGFPGPACRDGYSAWGVCQVGIYVAI